MQENTFVFVEHEPFSIDPEFADRVKPSAGYKFDNDIKNKITPENAQYFGLKFGDKETRGDNIYIGPYVGLNWLPNNKNDTIIKVRPKKFGDNKIMNYAEMFAACLGHPIVGAQLKHCFFVYPDAKSIPVTDNDDIDLSLLLIYGFINELDILCRRHLRRHFHRRQESRQGGVKGRILVSRQIQTNLVKLRPDRIQCEYNEFNDDCRENRILRAGLEVASAFLSRKLGANIPTEVSRKISACRAALIGVRVVKIHRRDFVNINYNGAFRAYKPSHHMAKAILCHCGINPENLANADKFMAIPPFVLCSFELFERYAEVILRKVYQGKNTWVGYQDNNLMPDCGRYNVRPDMIIARADGTMSHVIDCKYKNEDFNRNDVYKSVAYAHHRGVKDKIKDLGGDCDKQTIVLLLPKLENCQSLQFSDRLKPGSEDKSFEFPIQTIFVICPEYKS